jgi:prepilin-type N-terminal cleavage/methylation domain-containing protein
MRKGFTLVELLTSMGIVGVLAGLLLPAIQAARESSRRASCTNNLRQVGVALLDHEQVQKALPVGAADSASGTWGFSWWVNLLPFLEESALFDRLDRRSAYCGSPILGSNGRIVDRVSLGFMLCPSSPLPPFWQTGSFETLMPSYVGISGATNHEDFPETRVETCCTGKNDGQISAGGVLVPNQQISSRQVSDGLSKTIAVGECSDYSYASNGKMYRIDGGFAYGWLTGTFMTGTPPNYATLISARPYNLITIRYPPNIDGYDHPGVNSGYGINNPLTSAHPGGVHVLKLDGSVDFVRDDVSIRVLKSMATRDDGIVLDAIP